MKNLLFGLIFALPACPLWAKTPGAGRSVSYCNTKFEFCVKYPESFKPQGESDSGDGQVFESGEDLKTELRVFGRYNVENDKPVPFLKFMENELEGGGGSVTYKSSKKDVVVISGCKDSGKTIYYSKVLFRDDRLLTLIVTYPQTVRKQMDPIVTAISGSFVSSAR